MHRDDVDRLFGQYRGPVFRFLRRLLRNDAAAEDLTQEAFLRTLRASYRADGRERAWIFQIARNLARDHARSHSQMPRIAETHVDPVAPGRAGLGVELDAALATLAEEDRAVFLMKEIGGLSYAEIAAACELTPDAVRSRLHRARLALRKQLT